MGCKVNKYMENIFLKNPSQTEKIWREGFTSRGSGFSPQQQKKKGSGKSPRRDRPMPPEPPRKNQPKDSTEQASLMKPYYPDMGR